MNWFAWIFIFGMPGHPIDVGDMPVRVGYYEGMSPVDSMFWTEVRYRVVSQSLLESATLDRDLFTREADTSFQYLNLNGDGTIASGGPGKTGNPRQNGGVNFYEAGRLMKTILYESGEAEDTALFEYDGQGRLVKFAGSKDTGVAMTYTYALGRIIAREERHAKPGNPDAFIYRDSFTYSPDGDTITRYYSDEHGVISGDKSAEWYLSLGRPVAARYLTNDIADYNIVFSYRDGLPLALGRRSAKAERPGNRGTGTPVDLNGRRIDPGSASRHRVSTLLFK